MSDFSVKEKERKTIGRVNNRLPIGNGRSGKRVNNTIKRTQWIAMRTSIAIDDRWLLQINMDKVFRMLLRSKAMK